MTRQVRLSGGETVDERAQRLAKVACRAIAEGLKQQGITDRERGLLVAIVLEAWAHGYRTALQESEDAAPPPAQGELPLGKRRGRR